MPASVEGWTVLIEREARRELDGLRDARRQDAWDTIDTLPHQPEIGKAMRRYKNVYRVYFWSNRFRVIYAVDQKNRTITVIRVRSRGTAYHGMRNPV